MVTKMPLDGTGVIDADPRSIPSGTGAKVETPRIDSSPQRQGWEVPLILRRRVARQSIEPITLGLPFPQGLVTDPEALVLLDEHQQPVPLQTEVLARWPGGSVQWLLLDFLAANLTPEKTHWVLKEQPTKAPRLVDDCRLHVCETESGIVVSTGAATFQLNRKVLQPFQDVVVNGQNLLDACASEMLLLDPRNLLAPARIQRVVLEDRGAVRATFLFEAVFTGSVPLRLLARLSFFAGTGLVRLRVTLHNPNRAHHRGGLWDLGDPGSMLFRDLSLVLNLRDAAAERLSWVVEDDGNSSDGRSGQLEIYQESSGGANWQSSNHVNRHGKVPLSFRGYKLRSGDTERFGHRASPVVTLHGSAGDVTVALPEFWQQFPKAVKVEGPLLRVGFFPGQFDDGFELQGGERKTHTLWLDFAGQDQPTPNRLAWVHEPTQALAPPEWYADSGAVKCLSADINRPPDSLDELLAEVTQGEGTLIDRREIIDEFGWRNFGEWYAEHEAEHYTGTQPCISHYNNQYDGILGSLLHYLRTGDGLWWQVGDPLARHVIDIDRYHTTKDKAAYNGGLFWFTDHYLSAETCTHRTYSRLNRPAGKQDYGGGPSSNHNFSSGLALYYLLTGDPEARAAVVGLADWVMAMDDGTKSFLGLFDNGPTGLASFTGTMDYHGPGRGPGNSINALLDAWHLTGQSTYLAAAETLIRRCIHPRDDIDARDLLNVEKRWSYTVFLVAVDRYLRLKAEMGALDSNYAYAQESLLAYATWMLNHEIPYFDHREQLEYPTEAWAGQELRKANVLRLAAAHAGEPLRSALLQRGEQLAQRAWDDLQSFELRTSTRALALMLVEGLTDRSLRTTAVEAMPRAPGAFDHGVPESFLPQKRRVVQAMKSFGGLTGTLCRVINPYRWFTVSWRF